MSQRLNPRPLWRWWLCCIAIELRFATSWQWPARLLGWCVLPEWLGFAPEDRE